MMELQIQNQIRDFLEKDGWLVLLNTQPRKQGAHKGRPDLTCIGPRGAFMEVEVKAEGKDLSEKQREYAASLHIRGHVCIVARSVEDVMEALK